MTPEMNLDRYLPETVRAQLEEQFYARVHAQALLEAAMRDPEFVSMPYSHPALFSDHGVVHVRDVAQQILQILDVMHGTLIPARDAQRLNFFMRGYGVIVAYLHDIGMQDFSPFGRAMHPEFAAQHVLQPEFDDILQVIWDENCGNIAWRLLNLHTEGHLEQAPRTVLREMLTMSFCHSKSKVSVNVLNDRPALRAMMLGTLSTGRDVLFRQYQVAAWREKLDTGLQNDRDAVPVAAHNLKLAETALSAVLADSVDTAAQRENLARLYGDFEAEAFRWLVADTDPVRALADDIIDTLRALRCADALRQRGTLLKTSGSYEIFVDQMTASALYALRKGDSQLFIVEHHHPIAAGEANLAGSELSADGNLRIAFHRGAFADMETTRRSAYYAATVVNDIQGDVIESLKRPEANGVAKRHDQVDILLEGVDDNLHFAEMVADELKRVNPLITNRVRAVPSLQHATPAERQRYLSSPDVACTSLQPGEVLERLAASGQRLDRLDADQAFQDVKLIHVRAGETLIEAGSPASFVYIPCGAGLQVIPLGGYQAFPVQPWMPLGNTGVIRGAIRNATVVSESDVQLLMIPKEVYLKHWHHPYTLDELLQRLVPHDPA